MRFATRTLLAALSLVLWAGTASAQTDVTFRVDLSLCPDDVATDSVLVRGSFNGWSDAPEGGGDPVYNLLTDPDNNDVYEGTFALEEGEINYKFYAGTPETGSDTELGYEDGDNRTYTVTAAAETLAIAEFNAPTCVANTAAIETLFSVDLNVATARGVFNAETDKVYFAGGLSGWGGAAGNEAFELTESSTEDGVYTKLLQFDAAEPGSEQAYKFIIFDTEAEEGEAISWESGDNRTFTIPAESELSDADENGFFEVAGDRRFFNDVGFDQVLEEAATVTFRVDLSPAVYWLEDNEGGLPFGAGETVTEISGLALNGPALWESVAEGGPADGLTDWATWGADGLGSREAAQFTRDGETNIWTLTMEYPVGALRTLIGKLGVNGSDNEANGQNDGFYPIEDGATVDLVFGAIRKADGSFVDDNGPGGNPVYDPYILFNNDVDPPTVQSVRNGGEADVLVDIEDGPGIAGLTIGATYPNPTRGAATLDLQLDRALDVRVVLYDVVGREVATLADGPVPAGETSVAMDVAGLAPGVYLLRVEADGQAVTRRMTVLR